MKCPICSTWAIRLETRSNAMHNTVRRRYECGYLHKFSTVERVVTFVSTTRSSAPTADQGAGTDPHPSAGRRSP
jgi:transcriptional regulator NrdR family protein